MFDKKKLVEAVELIQEYCDCNLKFSKGVCGGCIFNYENIKDIDAEGCMFNDEDDNFPWDWPVSYVKKGLAEKCMKK